MDMIYEDVYTESIQNHLEQLERNGNLHMSIDNEGYLMVGEIRTPIFVTSLCPMSIHQGINHIIIRQRGCEIEINPHGQITMWLRVENELCRLYGLQNIHETLEKLGPDFFLSLKVNALFPRNDDIKLHGPHFDLRFNDQCLFLQEQLARTVMLVLVGKKTAAELIVWICIIRTLYYCLSEQSITSVEAIISPLEQFLLKNYYL